ncbi:GNAT family N-acetyltransferase [Nitrospirillum iridis]|uniref:Phosphinothricin acetyltransferase n=1 Tax=Nitrospirillum iridis TaxID=765888 RepID=A0A7X0B338_9PROT|nr:GNAT family N-acetyltransferase [Nitrospirillum iridis]MBB6253825.1 phosphinothricin acetyltransferase [Nitrospirillum iridis]
MTLAPDPVSDPGPATAPTLVIRPSTEADVEAMLAIYSHYINRGLGDYEPESPDEDDIKRRRKNMLNKRLPHVAAELDGVVVGYAYAVPFRKRPAYRYVVKHSIYVHHDHLSGGIGRRLMRFLIEACTAAGYRQMIGYIDAANDRSLRLHESFGFTRAGYLPSIGYKFGRWTDSVLVIRPLGEGSDTPPAPMPKKAKVKPAASEAADTPPA